MAETETPPNQEAPKDEAAPPSSDDASLESPDTQSDSLESTDNPDVTDATGGKTGEAAPAAKKGGIKKKLGKYNIYLLLFGFILVIAGLIIVIAYLQSQKASTTSTLKTQSLTQNTLQQVANSDATVGNAQTVLNVESSAVFAGKVLIREDLEVAGTLEIGGTVALNNLAVNGSSQFGQVSISKSLALSGDAAIQGALTIGKSIQVNGGGTFNGPVSAPQVTTANLQLNGDLVLTHHITAGGGTPGRSNGPGVGSGGSASLSGADTAGTVSINVGSSPVAGCFINITFTTRYNNTPHVLITPIGPSAASIPYYTTRDTSGFSICDAAAAPAGTSFAFDYFVVD